MEELIKLGVAACQKNSVSSLSTLKDKLNENILIKEFFF